ncbi:hypothetical protein FQN49_001380 [Arthroderma sp. PD_2]|nr:hypothetical protein FQN49_001380 [Arthroderma sp. PD_2]
MSTAVVFGCTEAAGSQVLVLLATETFSSIKAISRKLPNAQSPKLQSLLEADTSKWGNMPSSLSHQGISKDAIKDLGLEKVIIQRPGMILGAEKPKPQLLEYIFRSLKMLGQGIQDKIDLNGSIASRAAVAAARMAEEGKAPSRYRVVEQADIKFGRDE